MKETNPHSYPSFWYYASTTLRTQLQSAAIGIDAGFNMVPCLSRGIVDKHNYDRFIGFVKDYYKDDDQVKIKANFIIFKAGEHPILPFKGYKFLRFSLKVSGAIAEAIGVDIYINIITEIAKAHFGSRI